MEKDATGVLPASGYYHPGAFRPAIADAQEEQAEEVREPPGPASRGARHLYGRLNGNYSTQEFMSEDMIQQIAAVDGIAGMTLP